MKAGSVWLVMAWGLMLCSEVLSAISYHRQSIPTEAGGSICTLSRKLKEAAPWTQSQLDALKKTRDAYASKFLDWKLHFHGSSACELNESILEDIRTDLEKVNEKIKKLSAKAIRAGALAAKSAGRLDEFITVFANAKGKISFTGRGSYCLGGDGDPAKRRNLFDCFPEGEKLEIMEANLGKIPESVSDKSELNLTAALKNVNHSAVAAYFNRIYWDDLHADCNLIKGACGGILKSANLENPLWWGGGILTIGKTFGREKGKAAFNAGEIANASKDTSDKSFWTASPSRAIPHLQKTLAAFQDFKESAAKITQKFTDIEKIEKEIEPCLSNETTEERPAQSCFQNSVKLNAELQATNALLARYHKEKGPLPSGSALILHQSVMHFLNLIAFPL